MLVRIIGFGAVLLAATLTGAASGTTATGPLVTAVDDPYSFAETDADLAFRRVRGAGARVVRVTVIWRWIAPNASPPANPSDPSDPRYYWVTLDRQVLLAHAHGLEPLLTVSRAPDWAEGDGIGPAEGSVRPDPARFAEFATAIARRYEGAFGGLPRVRYYQAWNEPNLVFWLTPQYAHGRPVSPDWYRRMLNSFSRAIHAVRSDNIVVGGGLAPFTSYTGDRAQWGVGPLAFMRRLLCLSKRHEPTCSVRSSFDVWAHHPYTSGGPTHHAFLPDDVSLGDLPEMRRLLDAAVKHRRIASRRKVEFWVTEFGWDTNPPDPRGVPLRLHARWVAEALFRMWRSGVTLVTWYQLRDQPFPRSAYQAGLYQSGSTIREDHPKPALHAFRFPFVALPERGAVRVWGRTPASASGVVAIERRAGSRWTTVRRLRADRHGIFMARLRERPGSIYRARIRSGTSLSFRATVTLDRPMYAFGTLPG